jgi:hypothetical protein
MDQNFAATRPVRKQLDGFFKRALRHLLKT